MEVTNKYIVTKTYVEGAPHEANFEIKAEPLYLHVEPRSNIVIVKNLYVSIDPYQLNRMKSSSSSQKSTSAARQVSPGQPIDANGVGRVVASGNPDFKKDDLVVGLLQWGEYCILREGTKLTKLNTIEFPLSYHIGVLGTSGLTAHAGFFQVCKPKKGETVFVSAASGSVGHLVGQFAKLFGCYVVGSAGSNHKVKLLKEKLGFDDAFNYREENDLNLTLKRYFANGIDIYFDNVGGKMLEAAIANMNAFGRVALCGVIAGYTKNEGRAAPDMIDVVYQRITIQGFLVVDYMHLYEDFISTMSNLLHKDQIHVLEDFSYGVESVPSAFVGLFNGQNVGKKLVQMAEE